MKWENDTQKNAVTNKTTLVRRMLEHFVGLSDCAAHLSPHIICPSIHSLIFLYGMSVPNVFSHLQLSCFFLLSRAYRQFQQQRQQWLLWNFPPVEIKETKIVPRLLHITVSVCVCVCIHIESSNYTVCVNYTHTLLANSISVLDMNEYVCKLY